MRIASLKIGAEAPYWTVSHLSHTVVFDLHASQYHVCVGGCLGLFSNVLSYGLSFYYGLRWQLVQYSVRSGSHQVFVGFLFDQDLAYLGMPCI